jgi:SulP family sulfate permease
MFFGSYAGMIPLAILASILLKVGYDIIDWNFVYSIKSKSKIDIFIALAVILMIVFINLIIAILVGTIGSYLLKKHYE